MSIQLSRRKLLHLAGAGAFLHSHVRRMNSQEPTPALQLPPVPIVPTNRRSTVSLVRGEDRRKTVHDALLAIDAELRPKLKRRKYVIIKPNFVSVTNQLAATHRDAVHGILDYLAPRFKGPVVMAESSAGDTMLGYENFRYGELVSQHRAQQVSLIDLNEEARYVAIPIINRNIHVVPVRLAARLLDPDAFILCAAVLKTHNTVVATLAVKNITLGAPLHSARGETPAWSDKGKYHDGLRDWNFGVHQQNYNMMLTAQKLAPYWGAAVIDGFEGMEGNGPASGTPVASRIAIASTDYVAADRVGVEAMGIDPKWIGYLQYCDQVGLGNYDISKIDVRGEAIAAVKKTYRLHTGVERHLRWMGPLVEDADA